MSVEDSESLSSAYSYITRAFGSTIDFKRQPTGNPQEREMQVEAFGKGLLERIKNQHAASANSNVASHSKHETTSTLNHLEKIFNLDRSSLSESSNLNQKVEDEHKRPKKSKFEESQALEPYKLSPKSKKSGFKPPSTYDQEYDQGKLPKIRSKTNAEDKFKKTNMFQREQDLRNILEKKSKK